MREGMLLGYSDFDFRPLCHHLECGPGLEPVSHAVLQNTKNRAALRLAGSPPLPYSKAEQRFRRDEWGGACARALS